MRFEIELPLPPKACSPNARGAWGVHSGDKAAYRRQCEMLYRAAINTGKLRALKTPVTVHLDFYLADPVLMRKGPYSAQVRRSAVQGTYIPKDQDNALASAKGLIDAMKDAGVIPGDTHRFVILGRTELHTKAGQHQGRSCVVVTLEEATE